MIVTILGPDDPVAAIDDHLRTSQGETLEHPVTANDVETSRLIDIDTLEIVTPPKLGTATVIDTASEHPDQPARVIQYKPHNLHKLQIDDDERREDGLTYQICDKGPDPQCATAQLRITIYGDPDYSAQIQLVARILVSTDAADATPQRRDCGRGGRRGARRCRGWAAAAGCCAVAGSGVGGLCRVVGGGVFG